MWGKKRSRRSAWGWPLALLGLAVSVLAAAPGAVGAPAVNHDQIVSSVPEVTPAVNDGRVFAITQVGSTIVSGGTFTSVTPVGGSAQTRRYLFAFNAGNGSLVSGFDPSLNGSVEDVIPGPVPGTVYVAGSFTQVNGANVSHVALLSTSTGQPVSGFRAATTNGKVNTIVLSGGRLFVGGNFTTAGGQPHAGLAALDATTGALDGYVDQQVSERHNNTGSGAQGAVGVRDMDVSAAGDRLVAVGNFRKVDGLDRDQLVMLSLGGSSSEVTPDWRTNRYTPYCFNWAFDTYMRGVSFSPDGSYFAVASTGGHNTGTLCDSAARFETYASGSDLQPTWVNHSGGDTLWGITVTETAIYVGGHQRWMNNSLGSDWAAPGAVPRPGLAALDTETGVPIAWNPGRNPRGSAVFALHATPSGLWLGSDTEYIGNAYQHRRPRIAFFPLASGAPQASDSTSGIPGTAFLGGGTGGRGNILYRVNAGGPVVGSVDNGPDWEGDAGEPSPYRNAGSNPSGWGSGATVDSSVPSGTPLALFDSERWSPSDDPAMNWDFAAPVGAPLEVRLYFANRCSCTSSPGQRAFDVTLDGNLVLDDFDIRTQAADQQGLMRSFAVTSDGNVDIDFSHVVENPLINAIEIVRTDQAPPTGGGDILTASEVTQTGASVATEIDAQGIAWSQMRGAFAAGGKLYYGATDGKLHSRVMASDGTLGPAQDIDPYNDPAWAGRDHGSGGTYDGNPSNLYGQLSSVTGMAYADGRLYYTLGGSANLHWRWFNTDSGIVGAETFTANGGRNWSGTREMFAAAGTLYYVSANGDLNAIPLVGGVPTGGSTLVDGPSAGGNDWRGRALYLSGASAPPPNAAPTAGFTADCTELVCTFDAADSADTDGTLAEYAWDFGGGASGEGQVATHTFADAGTYQVELTVTDDDGATDVATRQVTVSSTPPSSDIAFVAAEQANANVVAPTVSVPAGVQAGDTLVLTASLNQTDVAAVPAGWTLVDSVSSATLDTYVWTRTATAQDAGGSVAVTMEARHKSALVLAAYRGVEAVASHEVAVDANTSTHTAPNVTVESGSWVVWFFADKSPSTSAWTAEASGQTRAAAYSTGSGRVSALVADSGGPVTGVVPGITATTDALSSRGASWSLVLAD